MDIPEPGTSLMTHFGWGEAKKCHQSTAREVDPTGLTLNQLQESIYNQPYTHQKNNPANPKPQDSSIESLRRFCEEHFDVPLHTDSHECICRAYRFDCTDTDVELEETQERCRTLRFSRSPARLLGEKPAPGQLSRSTLEEFYIRGLLCTSPMLSRGADSLTLSPWVRPINHRVVYWRKCKGSASLCLGDSRLCGSTWKE